MPEWNLTGPEDQTAQSQPQWNLTGPEPDKEQWIRSELFPIKRNPDTGELKLAYPGFVKELAGSVKSAMETPQAYDPTTGEVHVSPEMMRAGAEGALIGAPTAPGLEAGIELGGAARRGLQKGIDKLVPPSPLTRAPGGQMLKRGNMIMNIAKTDPGEYTRENLGGHLEGLKKELDKVEYNPRDHPLAAKALGRVQSFVQGDEFVPVSGRTHDIRDLHTLMQAKEIKAAKNARNPKEQKYGVMIGKMLDDYASGLGDAGPQLLQGKQLHSIGRQKLVIEGALKRAISRSRRHYTGAGLPHAISMEFEKLKKPKIISQFNPDVRAGIEKLAEGGSEAQRLASFIGKGTMRSPMGFALDYVLGGAVGLPVPVVGAIGEGGRQVARQIAKKEISYLLDLTEAGSKEKLAQYAEKVNPKVAEIVASNPAGQRALKAWLKTATPASARVLSITMARLLKRPDLAPRIQQELENMDQDNNGRSTSLTPAVAPAR